MTPESSSFIERLRYDPRLVVLLGIGIFLIVIVIMWLLWVRYPSFVVSPTPLNAERDFSYLKGSEIYSYNGLAFYKIDLAKNNEVTVLAQGQKLPTPKNIFWADSRGALVTFDESFILTKVEQALLAAGQDVSEVTESFVWYIDFSDFSVHLVSEAPINPQSAAFSAVDKGFYYIPDFFNTEADEVLATSSPMHFYNIETKKDETISDPLNLTDITYVGGCPDSSLRVCFIGSDKSNLTQVKLVAINRENKLVTLLETPGKIFSTNSPSRYITARSDQPVSKHEPTDTGDHSPDDVDFARLKMQLHDLEAKKTSGLGFTIDSEDIFPYVTSKTDYYALSTKAANDSEASPYVAGAPSVIGLVRGAELPMKFADGTIFSDGVRDVAGYGDNKTTLGANLDGELFLFSPEQQTKTISSLKRETVEGILKGCVNDPSSVKYFDEEKLFKIYFLDNATFAQNAASFSDCVTKKDKRVLVGYSFYFGGRDPSSGRFTTD